MTTCGMVFVGDYVVITSEINQEHPQATPLGVVRRWSEADGTVEVSWIHPGRTKSTHVRPSLLSRASMRKNGVIVIGGLVSETEHESVPK